MNIKRLIWLSLIVVLSSCGVSKQSRRIPDQRSTPNQENTTNKLPQSETAYEKDNVEIPELDDANINSLSPVEKYIYQYAGVAQEEMRLYGVPASIKLAQGILESGSGNGNLAKRSNNHFGIKCNGWQGEKVYHDDDEAQECFRKYSDASFSFRDHSLFLSERSRYQFLFDYNSHDYTAWAKGLKRAGYATDPRYPNKLISLIERYNLDQYDVEVIVKNKHLASPKSQVNFEFYKVKPGDTLYNISNRYNLSVEELKSINNLNTDQIQIGQELKVKTK